MKQIQYLLITSLLSVILIGCVTVPLERVPQPWIRSLRSSHPINSNAKIKIEVSGTTTPLLGDEQLTADRIREKLEYLLIRRGFTIENGVSDYLALLSYKTERSDKFQFSSTMASTNVQAYTVVTSSGAGATSGLGVSIARAVSALVSGSSSVSKQSTNQMLSYTHTISIELRNREGLIIWKGESTWDSNDLNLINRIVPAIQLMLSDLPADLNIKPEIPEIKKSHVLNYYKLECGNNWFTCPALPYTIKFKEGIKNSIPRGIEDRYALAAYVDLIQTAEYALPDGDEDDWKDPINVRLWRSATLGGQYFLGPSKKPINIIIKLIGRPDGYYIDECKVVTNEEYATFSTQFAQWRQILQNYYDVYVQ